MKSDVKSLVELLMREWGKPRQVTHDGLPCPLLLHCEFLPPDIPTLQVTDKNIPNDIKEFWSKAKGADIFKDGAYGQWGLRVLTLNEVLEATNEFRQRRPKDAKKGDLVVGTFYGDTDLLVTRADPDAADHGSMLIALPLDTRRNWHAVGRSFTEFLKMFISSNGGKFWEHPRR